MGRNGRDRSVDRRGDIRTVRGSSNGVDPSRTISPKGIKKRGSRKGAVWGTIRRGRGKLNSSKALLKKKVLQFYGECDVSS